MYIHRARGAFATRFTLAVVPPVGGATQSLLLQNNCKLPFYYVIYRLWQNKILHPQQNV